MSASEPLDIKNYIGLTGDTPIRLSRPTWMAHCPMRLSP